MYLFIDLVDNCNLHCRTCIRGIGGMKPSANRMSVSMCKSIIEKAANEGIGAIGFYNWSEPCLASNLYDYVKIVKDYNLYCSVSTNLSFNEIDHLKQSLVNGLDLLIVSVSGFDQKIYEINHAGGDIELVKNNLNSLVKF